MANLVFKVGQDKVITTKGQLVSILKQQLSTRPEQAVKGLMRIYANQTLEEQIEEDTKVHNGKGFCSADAKILSSFAKQYKSKGFLTAAQMSIVYNRIPKYARQLIESSITDGKIKKVGQKYVFNKTC